MLSLFNHRNFAVSAHVHSSSKFLSAKANRLAHISSDIKSSGPIISYYKLASSGSSPFETLYVIKNSKFYTKIFHVENVDEVSAIINEYKDVKASHNCWAYRDVDLERVNDDGEPGGTAGRPILSAIQEHNLMKTLVLVTRFFGGIKLGTGGLSRAYAAAAQQVISECKMLPVYEKILVNLSSKTTDLGVLYQIILSINTTSMSKYSIFTIEKLQDEHYEMDNDIVTLQLSIHSFILKDLESKLVDMTKGKGSIEIIT